MNKSQPNFFIVGAAKSGTTSLAKYLSDHPHIFKPEVKEPRFFVKEALLNVSDEDPMKAFILNKSVLDEVKYFNLFNYKDKTHMLSYDASVVYLYHHKEAIPKIKQKVGDVPIIIMLRNPIERAISNINYLKYWHNNNSIDGELEKERMRINNNYNSFWFHKDLGLYSEQVKAYLDNFSRVKIILFENFKNNPGEVYNEIIEFLGLEKFELETFEKSNETVEPNAKLNFLRRTGIINISKKIIPLFLWDFFKDKSQKYFFKKSSKDVSLKTKNALKNFFTEDILKLEKLIHMELKSWKEY